MRKTAILLLLAVAACAGASSIGGGSQSTAQIVAPGGISTLSMVVETDPVVLPLAASPAGAWAKIPMAYSDIGIPLTLLLPEPMIAGNQGFNVRRELGGVGLRNYILCGDNGSGPNADSYLISMNVATQIQKQDDGTSKAATVMDATATSMTTGTNSIRCSSTGELEKRINHALAHRLNLN